jgi:hypothetical protein
VLSRATLPAKRTTFYFSMAKLTLAWRAGLLLLALFAAAGAGANTNGERPAKRSSGDMPIAGEIPTGFKADRYTQLWERNPFTLVTPGVEEVRPSPFEKLFLASWFKDGERAGVYVQNSDTNESSYISQQPNKDSLRLIALRLNTDPKLVEAVISDGKEEGSIKFKFETLPGPTQVVSSPAVPAAAGQPPPRQTSIPSQGTPADQTLNTLTSQPASRPLRSGAPAGMRPVPIQQGGSGGQRARGRDGVRLANPGS